MSGAPWGKNRPFFVFRTATKLVLSRLYSFAPPLSQRRSSQAVASFHGNAARDANSRSAEKSLTDRWGRPTTIGRPTSKDRHEFIFAQIFSHKLSAFR